MNALLLDEQPLLILPGLAVAIGLPEAMILQQLHYYLRGKNGKILADGQRYIYNTYAEWHEIFPFWSDSTIKRTFAALEERKLVVSVQPEKGISRRKYYRIDYEVFIALTSKSSVEEVKLTRREDHIDPIGVPDWSVPTRAEKTAENTSNIRAASPEPAVDCPFDDPPVKPAKPRNVLFDALAEAEGSNVSELGPRGGARIAVALKEIKAASPDVTPEEIKKRAANFRASWPKMSLTANALAAHWAKFGHVLETPVERGNGYGRLGLAPMR